MNWTVLADLTWTDWSKFNEIRIRFDHGKPDAVTPENWRNTVRLSPGLRYELNSRWTLGGRIGYENSVNPDPFRAARRPGNSHTLVGAGFNCRISRASSLDFGYLHTSIRGAGVNFAAPGAGTLVGNYKISADAIGIQYNHGF